MNFQRKLKNIMQPLSIICRRNAAEDDHLLNHTPHQGIRVAMVY